MVRRREHVAVLDAQPTRLHDHAAGPARSGVPEGDPADRGLRGRANQGAAGDIVAPGLERGLTQAEDVDVLGEMDGPLVGTGKETNAAALPDEVDGLLDALAGPDGLIEAAARGSRDIAIGGDEHDVDHH